MRKAMSLVLAPAAAALALAILASCDEPKKGSKTKDTTETPTAVGDAGAARDAAPLAARPVIPGAPAGTVRLAGVPGNIALHFAAGETPVIIHASSAPVTFASSATSSAAVLDQLVARLGAVTAKRGKITIIVDAADKARAVAAARVSVKPAGRDVDLDFSSASGENLMSLLADVGRLETDGVLGGTFAMRLRRVPGNQLLATLAALCGAGFELSSGRAVLSGSRCKVIDEPPPPLTEPVFDDLGRDVVGPGLDVSALQVAGIDVSTKKHHALLRTPTDHYLTVDTGDIVGKEIDACDAAPAQNDGSAAAIRAETAKLESRLRALSAEMNEMGKDKIDEQTLIRLKAITREVDQLTAAVAALQAPRAEVTPDLLAECAGRGGVKYRWAVEAIDARGVRMKPLLGAGDADIAPMRLELPAE